MVPKEVIWYYGSFSALVLLLAIVICLFHRLKRRTVWTDYAYGAGTWIATVVVKILLAILFFYWLRLIFGHPLPLVMTMMATGLLTGATECVGTFFIAKTKRWQTASWDSSVAFGLGFGCFEAAILAAFLLLGVLMALFQDQLSPDDARAIASIFTDPDRPLTFFAERAIAVPVHLLSSVLIIRAVQARRQSLFWWGFALKSLIDAVPADKLTMPILQGIYFIFGAISFVVFLYYFDWVEPNEPNKQNIQET